MSPNVCRSNTIVNDCYDTSSAPSVLIVLVNCTEDGDRDTAPELCFLLVSSDSACLITKLSRVPEGFVVERK